MYRVYTRKKQARESYYNYYQKMKTKNEKIELDAKNDKYSYYREMTIFKNEKSGSIIIR